MPQLNPMPWFLILVISWSVLLTLIPSKRLAHHALYKPNIQNTEETTTNSWNWPWQ